MGQGKLGRAARGDSSPPGPAARPDGVARVRNQGRGRPLFTDRGSPQVQRDRRSGPGQGPGPIIDRPAPWNGSGRNTFRGPRSRGRRRDDAGRHPELCRAAHTRPAVRLASGVVSGGAQRHASNYHRRMAHARCRSHAGRLRPDRPRARSLRSSMAANEWTQF